MKLARPLFPFNNSKYVQFRGLAAIKFPTRRKRSYLGECASEKEGALLFAEPLETGVTLVIIRMNISIYV